MRLNDDKCVLTIISLSIFEFLRLRSTFHAKKKKAVDLKTSTVGCSDIRDAFVVEDDSTDTDEEAQHPLLKIARMDGPKVADVYSTEQVYGHHFIYDDAIHYT